MLKDYQLIKRYFKMKKIIMLAIFTSSMLVSCKGELDGKILKDSDGNIYRVEGNDLGNSYMINQLDTTQYNHFFSNKHK